MHPLTAPAMRKLAKMGANYRSSLLGMQKLCWEIYNPLPMYKVLKEQWDETKVSARFCCPLGTFRAIGTGSNGKNARLAATSDLLGQLANFEDGKLAIDAELLDLDASTESTQEGNGNGAPVVSQFCSKKRKKEEIEPLTAPALRKLAKMGANYRSSLLGMEELCRRICNPFPMYKVQGDGTKVSARFCCPLGTFRAIGTGMDAYTASRAAASALLEQLLIFEDSSPAIVDIDTKLSDVDAAAGTSTDPTKEGKGNGAAVVAQFCSKKQKKEEIKPLTVRALRRLAKMGASYPSSLRGMAELCCEIRHPHPMYKVLEEQEDGTKVSARFCCPLGTFRAIGTGISFRKASLAAASALLEQLGDLDDGKPALEVEELGKASDSNDLSKSMKKKKTKRSKVEGEHQRLPREAPREGRVAKLAEQGGLTTKQIRAARDKAAEAMIANEQINKVRNVTREGAILAFSQCAELLRIAGDRVPWRLDDAIRACEMHGLIDSLTAQLMHSLRNASNMA
eukprot:gene30910-35963_t